MTSWMMDHNDPTNVHSKTNNNTVNSVNNKIKRMKSDRTLVVVHAAWKVVFALCAVADMAACWPLILEAVYATTTNSHSITAATCPQPQQLSSAARIFGRQSQHNEQEAMPSCAAVSFWRTWIGPVFCCFCIVESMVRAWEARRFAIENHALDTLERTLTRVYSKTRTSFADFGLFKVANNNTIDKVLARSTLRTWIPVLMVIAFWMALLPACLSGSKRCGEDTAMATVWITAALAQYNTLSERLIGKASHKLWRWLFPFKLHQPRRFYLRMKKILRWIKWARFAGPLLRMCLKLNDQLMALIRMWRQSTTAQTEKEKRLAHRSMLFEDIQRVESLAKVQTTLAALPSQQLLLLSNNGNTVTNTTFREQKERGTAIRRQLVQLKRDLRSPQSDSSDLYDRMVRIRRDLVANPALLISPHSRFSVAWRLTVTNCLLVEMFRLSASWRLTGTFRLGLSQILGQEEPHHAEFKRRLADILPWFAVAPSSRWLSAAVFLQLTHGLESLIDIVSFLDIFIWFFTGDLDSNGLVVPKSFFSRCILPGTLVQVLDHPTLPETLPTLIAQLMTVAALIGWSRSIRWILAIGPAVAMIIVWPVLTYFFRHVENKQGIMRVAESCGILAPARSWTTTHGNASHGSQIGMSFDDDGELQEQDDDDQQEEVTPQKTIRFGPSTNMDEDDYKFSYSAQDLQDHGSFYTE
jgi:hypothetical protein